MWINLIWYPWWTEKLLSIVWINVIWYPHWTEKLLSFMWINLIWYHHWTEKLLSIMWTLNWGYHIRLIRTVDCSFSYERDTLSYNNYYVILNDMELYTCGMQLLKTIVSSFRSIMYSALKNLKEVTSYFPSKQSGPTVFLLWMSIV